MRRALASLAGLLAALAALPVAVAAAAPTLVTSHYRVASGEPLGIAGAATVVAAQGGSKNSVVSLAPGRAPLLLGTPHTAGSGGGNSRIAISATRLAVLQEGYEPGYKGSTGSSTFGIFASGLGAPLQEQNVVCNPAPGLDEAVRVSSEGGIRDHYAIALSGDVVAYDSFGCVIVRDLASGLQRVIRLQATVEPVFEHRVAIEPTALAVAGRLVAYRANPPGGEGAGAIVVYDIDADREVYRVPVPAPEAANGTSFAVQADGTVVMARYKDCTATVATPTAPTRPLGVPACFVEGLDEGRALVIARSPSLRRQLAWTALSDPALHAIADLGYEGSLLPAAPRLSGSTAVYALRDCTAPRVYRTSLPDAGIAPAPPASCPLHLGARATIARGGVSIPATCPRGCEVDVLGLRIGRRAELDGRKGGTAIAQYELEPTYMTLSPRAGRLLRLGPDSEEPEDVGKVLRRAAARVRHHHRLFLRIDLRVATPASQAYGFFEQGSQEGAPSPTEINAILPLRLPPHARR